MPSSRGEVLRAAALWSVAAVVLLGLVLVASSGTAAGVGSMVVAAGLLAVVTLGFERLATLSFLAAMFLAPLNDVRPVQSISFATLSDVFFVLGFFALVPLIKGRRMDFPSGIVVSWVLMGATGLVASALSPDPLFSLNGLARLVAALVLLPLAIRLLDPGRQMIDRMVIAYVAGACFGVLAALAEGPNPINNRYDGLTTHPNFYGQGSLLALVLCLYLHARVPQSRRWQVYVAGLICVVGVLHSGSRAALLVALAVAVMVPVIERSGKATLTVIAGGLLAMVLAAGLGVFSTTGGGGSAFDRLRGDATTERSDSTRENALRIGFERFVDSPLTGHGFDENSHAAHNSYLQMGIAIGIIGLIGFVYLLWAITRPLWAGSGDLRRLSYGPLAFAMNAMVANSLWDRFIWAVLALCFLPIVLNSQGSDPPDEDERGPAGRRPGRAPYSREPA